MKTFEIVIAVAILILAIVLFYRNLRSKSEGICNCDTCAAKCPNRDTGEGCDEIVFLKKKP